MFHFPASVFYSELPELKQEVLVQKVQKSLHLDYRSCSYRIN